MAAGSVLGWPAASKPMSSGTVCPALSASTRPNQEVAEVAMSTTTHPCWLGTPMAKGLVPKIGSVAPWGVTYSGDWDRTIPISPCSASCLAQYLCDDTALEACLLVEKEWTRPIPSNRETMYSHVWQARLGSHDSAQMQNRKVQVKIYTMTGLRDLVCAC